MKGKLAKVYGLLIPFAIVSILLFMLAWLPRFYPQIAGQISLPHIQRAIQNLLSERSAQLIAMVIAAVMLSLSALAFQTLTGNRILTPAALGFDAIYAVSQTLIVATLGYVHVLFTNAYLNFILTSGLMVGIVFLMYSLVLRKHKNNMVLLLLIGIIISSLAASISNVIQASMSEDAFFSVKAITSVTITSINADLVLVLLPVMIVISYLMFSRHQTYDVMALGEAQATNLGVDYPRMSRYILFLVALAVALATALVGPLSFLGLLAVNLARELTKRYEHKHLFMISVLLAIIFLFFGQALVELTGYKTTVTTLIALIGGVYMIYLLLRKKD